MSNTINKEEYERDLQRRQREHLKNVQTKETEFQPCLHDQCMSCHGTGVTLTGALCMHMIYCPCPKCSTR